MATPNHPTEPQSLNLKAHALDEVLHQLILQSWPGRQGMENLEMECYRFDLKFAFGKSRMVDNVHGYY